jgi:hypothetical protein
VLGRTASASATPSGRRGPQERRTGAPAALLVGCRNSDVVGGLRVRSTRGRYCDPLFVPLRRPPRCCHDLPT